MVGLVLGQLGDGLVAAAAEITVERFAGVGARLGVGTLLRALFHAVALVELAGVLVQRSRRLRDLPDANAEELFGLFVFPRATPTVRTRQRDQLVFVGRPVGAVFSVLGIAETQLDQVVIAALIFDHNGVIAVGDLYFVVQINRFVFVVVVALVGSPQHAGCAV